jgi:ribose transport system permease protein
MSTMADQQDRTTPDRARAAPRTSRQPSYTERYAGPALLVVIFVVFSVWMPDTFPTYTNLIAVANNQMVTAMVALGLLLPLATGVFDISVGGMVTLCAVTSASLFQGTGGEMPVVLVIVITLAVAATGGLLNALLVVRLGIDPFIVTLGTGSVFLGISQYIADGKVVAEAIPTAFTDLGRSKLGPVPLPIVYVAVAAALLWYLFAYTPLGRQIYATGAAREASRLAGVRTDRLLTLAFVGSAVGSALAALIYVARIGVGQPDVGAQYLLPAYAACFLGSTMIRPGRFNVPGLLIGIAILAIGINGLQLHGIPSWVIPTFQGGALVLAVVLTRIRSTSR